MPQKHTPLQSFPFDIRTVEKRCSYVNTISINLALIKSNGNSDVVNILDMYAKDRHFLANSAPEAGNVSNREKSRTSRNFPLMCKIMAETAPTRPILSPPAAPFLSAAVRDISLSGATHFCQQRQNYFFFASGGPISFNSERNGGKNAAKNPWFLDFLLPPAAAF